MLIWNIECSKILRCLRMRQTRDFFGFRFQQTYERGALISENVLILREFCFLELSQISWASKAVRKALIWEDCCFWVNSDSQNSGLGFRTSDFSQLARVWTVKGGLSKECCSQVNSDSRNSVIYFGLGFTTTKYGLNSDVIAFSKRPSYSSSIPEV